MDAATATAMVELVEAARPRMRASTDTTARDEVEGAYPTILEAFDWLLKNDRSDAAYRLASALVPFWMATKRLDEGASRLHSTLRRGSPSATGRARAVYDHGYVVFWAGRYDLASTRFEEARALAEGLGDADLQALALAGSARVALNDDVDEAVRLLRDAMRVSEDVVDSPGRSSAMHVLGVALQMSGDLEGARNVMRDRLDLGRSSGDESIVFIESTNLSMVERRLGHLDAAEALSRDALAIVVRTRNQLAIPWVINGLAAVAAGKGEHERSATLLGVADGLLERAGGEWPPDEREQHDETLAAPQGGPESGAIDRLQQRGRAMTLEDGVAYALANAPG